MCFSVQYVIVRRRVPGRFHTSGRRRRLLQDAYRQDELVGGRTHVQGIQQTRTAPGHRQPTEANSHQIVDFTKLL